MLAIPASATTVTLTSGMTSGQAGATSTDFESGVPAGWSFTGNSGIVTGSIHNVILAPAGDASNYAFVGTDGKINLALAAPTSYFGLYWGSADYYNKITFTDVNGVSTTYTAGSGLLSGLDIDTHSSQYVNFFSDGAAWASVIFESRWPAFEFDNVAVAAASIPEPASLALLAGGLVAIGVSRRRKS